MAIRRWPDRRSATATGGIIARMTSTPVDGQAATLAALLDAAGRKGVAVPLRRSLVQQGTQREPKPGPLQQIVQRHDETALDLYLIFMALASSAPWDVTRDAKVWGRALGHHTDVDGGTSIVSKAWRRLDETYGLVTRERSGRLAKIIALEEDGQRGEYTYPNSKYLRLPFAYWTAEEAWHRTLSLPAKAMLLVSLSLKSSFVLPAEKIPGWYGISADTADRGLRELRAAGLLSRRFTTVENWLSPTGKMTIYTFRLTGPFARGSKRHLAVVADTAAATAVGE
jgi:hypothetical protein